MYLKRSYANQKPHGRITLSSHPLTQNLVAAWGCWEGGGNLIEDFAGANHIRSFGAAGANNAVWTNRRAFDCTYQGWVYPTAPLKPSAPPISLAWYGYIVSTIPDFYPILECHYDEPNSSPYVCYGINADNTGKFQFQFNRSGSLTGVLSAANRSSYVGVGPVLLTATGKDGLQKIYINNSVDGTNSFTWTGINYGATARIGFAASWSGFSGYNSIQALYGLVWNRELTNTEVSELYNNPYIWTKPQGPSVFYSFPGGGTIIQSLSSRIESASDITSFISRNRPLDARLESETAVAASFVQAVGLASTIESSSTIDTLLSRSFAFDNVRIESASQVSAPVLSRSFNFSSVRLESQANLNTILGLIYNFNAQIGSQTDIRSSLSSLFIGGIAAFTIEVKSLAPVAAVQGNHMLVAIVTDNNDNESAFTPNPTESPDDLTWF